MMAIAASVLKRKVAAAGDGALASGAARAFAQALARAANDAAALPLRAAALADSIRSLAELPELLEDNALLTLLDGPGEATGLCAVGPGLLSALIEAQTTGRLAAVAPDPRRPTRTDAAIAAGLVDAALSILAEEAAEDASWVRGFRYGSCLDDPRLLQLVIEDAPLRVLRLDLRLGEGDDRDGTIFLALPAGREDEVDPKDPEASPAARDWRLRLERAVLGGPIEVDAMIARVQVTAATVMSLKPGMLLPFPGDRVGRVTLEVGAAGAFARGRLGRLRGARALRIDEFLDGDMPDAPAIIRPLSPPLDGLGQARAMAGQADSRATNRNVVERAAAPAPARGGSQSVGSQSGGEGAAERRAG
ncbi:FliM/FliN family flagellar motor switch protein [Albidovulum sp.]|uniref:FliM/FliN family flagellar motor switch protein n=1 Tax=Albidovulum sp. TaxID=1872424 RepID=UPI002C5036A3|nr:FliM/FliN family flagellar motor switch protein [Albidovulum sp.]